MAVDTHELDFFAWCQEQAARLRGDDLSGLDRENLAEELESLGSSEWSELESRLTVLIAHLLKYRYQPDRRGSNWVLTIREQRRRIGRRLAKSPSLHPLLPEIIEEIYGNALQDARVATRVQALPARCPFLLDDILRDDFYPD